MSFWDLGDGTSADEKATGEYVGAGGDSTLPNNTNVEAYVEKAETKWNKERTIKRVNIQWRVTKPLAYEGRVQFQSLYVYDLPPNDDPEKAKKRQREDKIKLANIDKNAGGKLVAALMKSGSEPSDDDLMLITEKPMVIKVMRLVPKDGSDPMNWIKDIFPKGHDISDGKSEPVAKSGGGSAKAQDQRRSVVDDDEIPF